MAKVRLRDAIRNLRSELEAARADAKGADIQFRVGTVEVELDVSVEIEGKATVDSGEAVGWFIGTLGAEGTASRGSTQKIKITLDPRAKDITGVRDDIWVDNFQLKQPGSNSV